MGFFRRVGRFLLDAIETIVMALALFVIMYLFLFQPHQVRGNSMLPNFYDKEYLLTDKISYRLTTPKRGEVVIFKAPKNEEYDYIKRIIGLPGEMVGIRDGQVYINDQVLRENYLPADTKTAGGLFLKEGQTIPVPDGSYFVLGDNHDHSSDSRDWGPVPKDNVIGKAWLRYWPLDKIGTIPKAGY
jgi:signal peptidase I